MKISPLLVFVVGLISTLSPLTSTLAAGKKPTDLTAVKTGKKVIELIPIQDVQVEMPDQSMHDFGQDFQGMLSTYFINSGRYILVDTIDKASNYRALDYNWVESVSPDATVKIRVTALSFQTGSFGDRMFYGLNENFRTPFNDGYGTFKNEFPLRVGWGSPNWFGSRFDSKGVFPVDSQAGLDLGDGFEIDILYAWLNVKYASYHSELRLNVEIQKAMDNAPKIYEIQVKGNGFFFDVAGAYKGYSAGISVARRDAMNQVVKSALSKAIESIDRGLSEVPLLAKIDAVLVDGTVLLGTGENSEIPVGVYYQNLNHMDDILQVDSSELNGSTAHLLRGNLTSVQVGDMYSQISALPSLSLAQQSDTLNILSLKMKTASDLSMTSESIVLAPVIIPPSNLTGLVPTVTRAQALAKSLAEAVLLPYRIWRYFSYDQIYHKKADGLGLAKPLSLNQEPWAASIGLLDAPEMRQGTLENPAPIIAVIDSGMDYNSPTLHDVLWLNSVPTTYADGFMDRYGWDFISQDSKPYDDSYHGTQVASVIAAVAPQIQVMPLKVFNPWGITSSASIYAAFIYAVDHGAEIIVCGWNTPILSQAIEMGVAYAQQHGVVVVTSAGDQGLSLSLHPSYPAALSKSYDNVMVVTGVDSQNQLIQVPGKQANYDSSLVQIAAPAENIPVEEPRLGHDRESSTDLAAALVAGTLARNLSANHSDGNYHNWIHTLVMDADVIPELKYAVKDGLKLHVRR